MTMRPQISGAGAAPAAWPDDFVCPDPEPRDMQQSPTISKSEYFVGRHFAGQPDTLVNGDIPVHYDPDNPRASVKADLCIAFGVDVPAIARRNGYIIHEVGKPPDFMLEVASLTTHQRDTGFKRQLYARLDVGEFWRVDPTGGNHYGYEMAMDELIAPGVYRPRRLRREPNGMVWGYSPALDLCLCWHAAWDWDVDDKSRLRFYNPKTGRYLCDMSLVERHLAAQQVAQQIAEMQLAYEKAVREAAEAARRASDAARAAAEARIRELEDKLRRQQSEC